MITDEDWVLSWWEVGGLELAYDVLCRHIDTYAEIRRRSIARSWAPLDERVSDYRKRTGRRLGELYKLKARLEHARERQIPASYSR